MAEINENKRNILYFEAPTMRQLHQDMERWQHEHEKRFLSMSINKDEGAYCCIALTNPSEVVLVNADYRGSATVDDQGALKFVLVNADYRGAATVDDHGALKVRSYPPG